MADWERAQSEASDEHSAAIRRFLGRVDPTANAQFISDEARSSTCQEREKPNLREAIHSAYVVTPLKADLSLPLWKLALQFKDGWVNPFVAQVSRVTMSPMRSGSHRELQSFLAFS